MNGFAPYDVSDYRLDPPDEHECSDENNCVECHEELHGKEHDYPYSETYKWCDLCKDYLDWQFAMGRICIHFEDVYKRGGLCCDLCTEFYEQMNVSGVTHEN